MRQTAYLSADGRVFCHENGLITSAVFNSLISASREELARRLSEYGYDASLPTEEMLKKASDELWALMDEIMPSKHELDSLIIRNDFHNLKTELKNIIVPDDISGAMLYPTVYDPQDISEAVGTRRFDALPECMADAAKRCYDVLTRTGSGRLADVIIDRASLTAALDAAKKADGSLLERVAVREIINADVAVAWRACLSGLDADFTAKALVPAPGVDVSALARASAEGMNALDGALRGSGLSIYADAVAKGGTVFEKLCDDLVMKEAKTARFENIGSNRVAAFVIAKRTEMLNLRILLCAARNGLDSSVVTSRARELYV
ncbi:MAG: V-type ATPase subunit [Clostridiales bacterium]|nr:V-type ATPase subunit [Clostridiales bacterium]